MTVWVRVRDLRTGHHYDVTLDRLDLLLARAAVEEIPGRRHFGHNPRPAKPRRRLGPASPKKKE